ncbi:MAG: ATPase [Nitrospira sp. ST-bin4]|nr:MAG: ATPase [Nitrospira sp. ST-bin4]
MAILQEILKWAKGLPAWQSDAIRRLFNSQTLSKNDVDDLYALLKDENGIPDNQGRSPVRLSVDQIPSGVSSGGHVTLLAMKDLQHVNAIAEKQRLTFGNKGITVIYGDNGSGKSGYSRVLKRACRARDQSEPIHPNAAIAATKGAAPQAKFEISINDVARDVTWIDGRLAPEELSSLAIFDSRCARAYLDEEDDFSFVPYGLDIFEGLAAACKQLEAFIKNELSQTTPDTNAFAELGNDKTTVGVLISNLSYKTKAEDVETLAALTAEQIHRRDELDKGLRAENPAEKAKQLRLLSTRVAKITIAATEKLALVNSEVVSKLRVLTGTYSKAKTASELVAQQFKSDSSLLPGTGGEAWKCLFDAAKTFCLEAHHEKHFQALGPGAQCPLCQQPLNDGAERLIRFEKFIQDESEQRTRASKKSLDEALKIFNDSTTALGFDEELFEEIQTYDKSLAVDIRDFERAIADRYKGIKLACATDTWDGIPIEPTSVATRLQTLSTALEQQAKVFEKAAAEGTRTSLETEFNELDARVRLSKVKPAVIGAISKYNLQEKLTKCLGAVKTTSISLKANELTDKAVSKELADALSDEFKALGAENLSVSLQSRSQKGKPLHKLKIELAQVKNPGDILSEGEQRAIAIGSFLAEANVSGGTGGIVFDDPVSSLDHKRREKVAIRLVSEASKRQVIIFTHDIYFLSLLMDEASRNEIPCLAQSLTRRPEGYGVAEPDLPFDSQGTKARVGVLKALQQEIAKLYKAGDDPEHKKKTFDAYRLLRNAWERAVEEVLFRGVVTRFKKGVSTQLLAGVLVEDSDFTTIDAAMTNCSNYTHDQALLGGTALPSPEELLADINELEEWRGRVDKRNKATEQSRKSGKSQKS